MVRNQSTIDTVTQFANAIREQGVNLRAVILFGSYARGDEREWSDIDVALVSDEFIGVPFEDIKQFIDVTIQKPYFFIEPHTFNTKEFEKGNAFVEEIRRTGVQIV
ncbi:MAG: nucleotidyltransferase domain-containing protein [Saprospiraceae bacterium]